MNQKKVKTFKRILRKNKDKIEKEVLQELLTFSFKERFIICIKILFPRGLKK